MREAYSRAGEFCQLLLLIGGSRNRAFCRVAGQMLSNRAVPRQPQAI